MADNLDNVAVLGNLLDLFKPAMRHRRKHGDSPRVGDTNTDERAPTQAGKTRKVTIVLPLGFFKLLIWAPLHLVSNCVIEFTLGPNRNAFKAGGSQLLRAL